MNSRLNAFIILVMAALTSCGSARHAVEFQKDSVFVRIHDSVMVHDTVVMVQLPAESDKAILPDSDTSRLQTTLAESEAFVKNGQLHHTLRNRSECLWPVTVQYQDRLRTEQSGRLAATREVVEVPRDLTKWQRFIMTSGYVALVLLILVIARKLRRLLT